MAATNKTPNIGLSQFVSGVDKPAWIADYNADMALIDSYATATDQRLETTPQSDGTLQANLNAEMLGGKTAAQIVAEYTAAIEATLPTLIPTTLTAAGWTGTEAPYLQAIPISGMTEGKVWRFDIANDATPDEVTAFASSLLSGGGEADGSVTIRAVYLPEIDIPIVIEV